MCLLLDLINLLSFIFANHIVSIRFNDLLKIHIYVKMMQCLFFSGKHSQTNIYDLFLFLSKGLTKATSNQNYDQNLTLICNQMQILI